MSHFGLSEHKILPRKKSFIEILSFILVERIPWWVKIKISKSIMKLKQLTDVLVVEKASNVHHETTPMEK